MHCKVSIPMMGLSPEWTIPLKRDHLPCGHKGLSFPCSISPAVLYWGSTDSHMSTFRTHTFSGGQWLELQSCHSVVAVLDTHSGQTRSFLLWLNNSSVPLLLSAPSPPLLGDTHFCRHKSLTSRSQHLNSDFFPHPPPPWDRVEGMTLPSCHSSSVSIFFPFRSLPLFSIPPFPPFSSSPCIFSSAFLNSSSAPSVVTFLFHNNTSYLFKSSLCPRPSYSYI